MVEDGCGGGTIKPVLSVFLPSFSEEGDSCEPAVPGNRQSVPLGERMQLDESGGSRGAFLLWKFVYLLPKERDCTNVVRALANLSLE